MKRISKIGLLLVLLGAFMFVNNTSLFSDIEDKEPILLAHRGVAQTFHMEGITGDTCTAERIYEPEHQFLENSIPSIEAAFNSGADIVEIDVHPTADGEFAVFHDWNLECRTDGIGVTREQTMEDLKKLDIGYGYTADDGKTFPFRGKGVGLMPTLNEVLAEFPGKSLLIHIKTDDPKEGELLAQYLTNYPKKELINLSIYGGDEPISEVKDRLPEIRVMSKATMKRCLLPYIATGWTGHVPSSCENTQLHIPEKIAPWLWGFSDKFVKRMEDLNTRVILVAGNGGFSEGFDNKEDVERLPKNFKGVIWTNRIDNIATLIKE